MKWIWQMCYTNMKQRGIRTGLTILGVVIGVISIVSLLAIGIGVKNTLMAEFTQNDSIRKITVTGVNEGKRKDRMITDGKIKEFEKLDYVEAVYPCLQAEGVLTFDGYNGYCSVMGVPRNYLESLNIIFGELPKEQSMKPELLMGQGAAYMFFNENTGVSYMETIEEEDRKNIDMSGKKLQMQFGYMDDAPKTKLSVVGMLNSYEFAAYCDMEILKRFLKQISTDGKIIGQPLKDNEDIFSEWIYTNAIVLVDDADHVDVVIKKLQDMGFQTENEKEYLDSTKKTVKIIQIMLGGIGMIALVVAVIGIGNTMTTSVYDRINEIGILKVLGCDLDELMYLFLLESGILGGLGGFIGLLCSYGIVYLIVNPIGVKLLDLQKGTMIGEIPFSLAIAALVFSVVLGVLAGFFPAKWASKLRPIDAVRRN